jgi:hypothetical protein
MASRRSHPDSNLNAVAKVFMRHGADPNIIKLPSRYKTTQEYSNPSILQLYARRNEIDTAKVILDPPLQTKQVLFCCCLREYTEESLFHNDNLPMDMFREIMKTIRLPADPNYFDGKTTALEDAVSCGNTCFVDLLLDHGADINYNPGNESLVLGPFMLGSYDMVELLLKRGAKPPKELPVPDQPTESYQRMVELVSKYQ